MIKHNIVRGVRKSAHLSRKVLSVGANYSGRVENKAHRIINGMDDTIQLNDKVLFEKLYYEALSYITPLHPALPRAGRKGQVTLLIPSLQESSFFGGTATAILFASVTANKLQKDLLVVETLKKGSATKEELRNFLVENSVDFKQDIAMSDISPRKYNNYGYIDLHPDDVFICSAWWDAYILQDLPLKNKFIYLIQDYEPIFYNNGDLRVLAESTYHTEKFIPVCNTKLMLEFMTKNDYTYIEKNGLFFEPAVNIGKRMGYRTDAPKGRKKLFIYGRPSVERNLFYTALKAVDEAFSERILVPDEWDCYMAGQKGISNILLNTGKEIKTLGKMSVEDYYSFAKDVDLGISLMLAPHPSYPPLELSSLGAAVVTTEYETKTDLSMYNNNLFVRNPSVASIKDGIDAAAKLSYEVRLSNAKSTSLGANWEDALNPVITKIVNNFVVN